jgi:rhodanese-related sulfurtransferase
MPKRIIFSRALVGLATGGLLFAIGALGAQTDDYMSPAVTPAEIKARLGTPQAPRLVDLRTPVEFAAAHVPGAVNVPVKELEKRLDEVRPAKGQDLVIYCLDGNRTREAEPVLYSHDIDNFYHLKGSLEGWLQKNYPVEKGGVNRKTW